MGILLQSGRPTARRKPVEFGTSASKRLFCRCAGLAAHAEWFQRHTCWLAGEQFGNHLCGANRQLHTRSEMTRRDKDIRPPRHRTNEWQAVRRTRPQASPRRLECGIGEYRHHASRKGQEPGDTFGCRSFLEACFRFFRGTHKRETITPRDKITFTKHQDARAALPTK